MARMWCFYEKDMVRLILGWSRFFSKKIRDKTSRGLDPYLTTQDEVMKCVIEYLNSDNVKKVRVENIMDEVREAD